MSRMPIARIDIFSNQTLPDLEALTLERATTNSWIRSQDFQFARLDASAVIELLSESAQISPFLWWGRSGVINVHDVVEDDGPVVQRRFHLTQTKTNGILHLQVTLEGA